MSTGCHRGWSSLNSSHWFSCVLWFNTILKSSHDFIEDTFRSDLKLCRWCFPLWSSSPLACLWVQPSFLLESPSLSSEKPGGGCVCPIFALYSTSLHPNNMSNTSSCSCAAFHDLDSFCWKRMIEREWLEMHWHHNPEVGVNEARKKVSSVEMRPLNGFYGWRILVGPLQDSGG